MISPLNGKLKNVEWGEFRIEEVLEWQPQKEIDPLKLEELKDESEPFYPFYGQATIDNGIISYNQLTKDVLNNSYGKPTILIHSNNQNIVYLETPFYLKDGHGATSVLQCEGLNIFNQKFIIASIDNVIKRKYSYNNKATKIELKNTIISLPVKNGSLDFDFMERIVVEIEMERILKLEKYLSEIGLNNHHLSLMEKKTLEDFENDKFLLNEFEIYKLFEIHNTKSFNKNKLVAGEEYDYVTRTSQNQGVLQKTGFVNRKNINLSGNWSLGLLQMDFFYRKQPWYAGQFVRKITFKYELTEKKAIFFTTLLNKLKNKLLTVLVRDVDGLFLKSKLKLPITKSGAIDYDIIETLVTAVQKLIIKDVVLYVERKKKELNKLTENANA